MVRFRTMTPAVVGDFFSLTTDIMCEKLLVWSPSLFSGRCRYTMSRWLQLFLGLWALSGQSGVLRSEKDNLALQVEDLSLLKFIEFYWVRLDL